MSEESAQNNLRQLNQFSFPVFVSGECEPQGVAIAQRCERAYQFFNNTFGVRPTVTLYVLSSQDWSSHTPNPTYGMPHFDPYLFNLIVAGEPGDFWHSLIDVVQENVPSAYQQLQKIYGHDNGDIDLSPFFDLLVVHELGHAFQHAGSCEFPRLWLMELYANLCLQAYMETIEPENLPLLEAFPEAMRQIDVSLFEHHSLADFDKLYSDIEPLNYVWYQAYLHQAATQTYKAGNVEALQKLWRTFRIPDAQLLTTLEKQVHPIVAQIPRNWTRVIQPNNQQKE